MKILFVCLGNICRSPLAEGILRKKLQQSGLDSKVTVDSVGFEPFHQGEHPDARAIRTAVKHHIDISSHTARLFTVFDFDNFDLIYVMDKNNYRDVMKVARNDKDRGKVDFIMNLIQPAANNAVPDPWYGNLSDFENTFQLLDSATEILLQNIKPKL